MAGGGYTTQQSQALDRFAWYFGFLGVIILLGQIAHSVSVLAGLNFSTMPVGDQRSPTFVAVVAWAFGLVCLLVAHREALRGFVGRSLQQEGRAQ